MLIGAHKNGGVEVAIDAPLILHDAPGVYSQEAREILGEVASSPSAK